MVTSFQAHQVAALPNPSLRHPRRHQRLDSAPSWNGNIWKTVPLHMTQVGFADVYPLCCFVNNLLVAENLFVANMESVEERRIEDLRHVLIEYIRSHLAFHCAAIEEYTRVGQLIYQLNPVHAQEVSLAGVQCWGTFLMACEMCRNLGSCSPTTLCRFVPPQAQAHFLLAPSISLPRLPQLLLQQKPGRVRCLINQGCSSSGSQMQRSNNTYEGRISDDQVAALQKQKKSFSLMKNLHGIDTQTTGVIASSLSKGCREMIMAATRQRTTTTTTAAVMSYVPQAVKAKADANTCRIKKQQYIIEGMMC